MEKTCRCDGFPAVNGLLETFPQWRGSCDVHDRASRLDAYAAGLSTGTVYRTIGSKEELLDTIMSSFYEKVMAGWSAALDSGSTAVEKLDALAWLLRLLRVESPSSELTARCVLELTWMPEQIVRSQGKRAALIHARDTVLRGIAAR